MGQPDDSAAAGNAPDVARVTAEIEANVLVRLGAAFWDWVDERAVIRRVMTLGTFAVVVQTTLWAQRFVETTTKSDAGVALMLGAVTAPITALMGFMFSTYQQSKREV